MAAALGPRHNLRVYRALGVTCLLATQAVAEPIGTDAPLARVMGASDARWFVLCQAREDTDGNGRLETSWHLHGTYGDELKHYLVLGSGAGTEIDYPAAQSERGEWLAVVRGGKLELIEAATYRQWTLSADTRDDWYRSYDGSARFVSIAANGTRMTYLRRRDIVIRDLATGAERVVRVNQGKLWRVEVDPAGRWARVSVLRKDTDHDGVIDWPGGVADGSLRACDADLVHHHNPSGDEPTELYLDLATGKLVEDTSVIEIVGEDLLRRRRDGALVLGRDVIVEPACKAEVAGTLASPQRVAVRCNEQSPIRVVGRDLDRQLARSYYSERWFQPHVGRFLYNDTHVLDLATADELELPGRKRETVDELVLVDTTTGWAIYDALHRTTRRLPYTGKVEYAYTKWLTSIGGHTIDVRTGQELAPDADIVFVDDHGRVLVRHRATPRRVEIDHGPLHWWP